MNTPLSPQVLRALQEASLQDKYVQQTGRAFMSGIHALVRLPLMQQRRDAAAGLDTAGFISGYRGSPLGGYDQALWAAEQHLQAHHIRFQPGVNEELAATAVWGSQQLDLYPHSRRFDGVFGLWYGKGPGVDRCSDVFKHANMAGTARHGGVIAVAGDDHVAKSSTVAHQSDHIFEACGLPVFYPASVQDILDMGQHAFAMSRFCGLWSGMKTVQEVVESSRSVQVGLERVQISLPQDFAAPDLHVRWPDPPLEQEARLLQHKGRAALAYVRANRLNHTVLGGPADRFGIISAGKAWSDARQALIDLGLDDEACRAAGIRLHKVGVIWPLEPEAVREFAAGLQEILVVEEKRPVLEPQLKDILYAQESRPRVLGKQDERGQSLLRAEADLGAALVARAIARRLENFPLPEGLAARIRQRIAALDAAQAALQGAEKAPAERQPWFCSGCPHNTSTRVPEGSRAVAGIGCHFMSVWMNRSTSTYTQMGGEGVTWVGQAAFSKDGHVFANLGDGTYFHSGILAIRQSIAAGVNITYKVLYNDAVAMTGGQRVGERPEGHSVLQIMQSLLSEGVQKLAIVTDEPQKYASRALAPGVELHHRDALDAVQRSLRAIPGCTAIIYDQTCATEKRRRRKRGTLQTPARSVIINEVVCEGCGDCSVQSNCLSVEPVQTEFGRKRRIKQSTCNQDFSCLKGFCPSFVTIEGGERRAPSAKNQGAAQMPDMADIPAPEWPDPCALARPWCMVVAGVGGTGVITIGSLLGMAAHLEGKGVTVQDSAGLAQKGGATWSHVQIAASAESIHTTRVDVAGADLLLGCEAIVAAMPATLALLRPGHTFVALNSHATPTAAFVLDPDWRSPHEHCAQSLAQLVGGHNLGAFDAEQVAVQLLGDSIYSNPLLLGYAWQKGKVPLTQESIWRALELNGVQSARNQAAFAWGRRCAHDLGSVLALLRTESVVQKARQPGLEELVQRRVQFLTQYQNAAWARSYREFVERVQKAEQRLGKPDLPLAKAVAQSLFQLMSCKDEYEVARLHTDAAFEAHIREQFSGNWRIVHHLAPPGLPGKDAQGQPRKRAFGPWMRPALRLLARLRFVRGTVFDVFGYSAERRTERALVAEYRQCIEGLLDGLTAERLELAVQIARTAQDIRGFGHVKQRKLQAARGRWQELLGQWGEGAPQQAGEMGQVRAEGNIAEIT